MPIPGAAQLNEILSRSNAGWRAKWSPIIDLDDAARRSRLGVKVNREELAELARQPRFFRAFAGLPAAVDWRNVNGANHVSPVKSQGNCGSCVSFCVCASVESAVSIAGGGVVDLSEADLHFCSAHGPSCGGWWPSDALVEAARRGVPPEWVFPYSSAFDASGNPSCKLNPQRDDQLFRPGSVVTLQSMDERKQWLATRGPLCGVFHVYSDFYHAGTDIYRHVHGDHEGYHCVEIIGYSDADRCWIAKNSWDTSWGDGGYFRIGYGECGIDETSSDRDPDGSLNRFPMYGMDGVQTPSAWRSFELAPVSSASQSGGVAAVSRIPNSMEVWWIGANGSVQAAYWYEGAAWARYELAPAGSASLNGGIAAVSRIPNSMEVWWIGANGSVQAAYWYEGAAWARYELAPAGSASTAGGICAVSRIPNSMELWWVGPNGSIQGAYWYEGSAWNRYELAAAGSAATGSAISAVSRVPNSMEVWWIGANGSVQAAYWYEGAAWARYELAPAGGASLSGGLSAVSRIPNSMELWWTGANGSVQAAYWYEGGTWARYELAPASSASLNGGISAVSRIPNSMELWWIGVNGSMQAAFWYEGGAWTRYELAAAGSASVNGAVSAVSRIPNSMELWWTGANGSVEDSYWYG
ncbi:hypothetical protein LJR225_000526 [Phenylobacterium sp. LjRoot225]|uniref:C1 family peptidase n=1 Tax=Phenylobacterium sp. LjRoot225 TaxID=3342285 RepID=UPI003ECC7FAB